MNGHWTTRSTRGADQLITWYLNVADGAPIGTYAIDVEILKDDARLVPSTGDIADVIVAAAPTHGGSGGGGGGGGDGDSGAAPSLEITSSPAAITSATDATLVFSTDATTVLCGLDGAAPTSCTSPVTYTGLPVGSHTFSVVALDTDGQFTSASYAWTIVPARRGLDDRLVHPGAVGRHPAWLGLLLTVCSSVPDRCRVDSSCRCPSPTAAGFLPVQRRRCSM